MRRSDAIKVAIAGGVAVGVFAACTSAEPQRRSSSAVSTPVPAPSSASPTRPVGGPVELVCADSTRASLGAGGGNLAVHGLTLEGAANGLHGSTVGEVGLRAPAGRALYFTKAPAYLKAGTAPITVELSASSRGYLAWVPAAVWTGGRATIDLRPWATSRLTFTGCPDRDATYLGGLLATDPRMCLTVNIRQAGAPPSPPTRLGGPAC